MAAAAGSARFDVVISGASYAGLALALALARTFRDELSVALVERRATNLLLSDDARAFALSAASQRMLTILGVWDAVADVAEPVTRIELTDSSLDSGVRATVLGYDNRVDEGAAASFIVPAAAIMRALLDAVAKEPAISVRVLATVGQFTASSTGLDVELQTGDRWSTSVLVAAEGRRSPVRELAGIKIVGWSYGQIGIVTTVAYEKPHGGCAVQHFLPGGPFAILPLTGNRSCVTWSESRTQAERILALDDQAFLGELDLRFGGHLGPLKLVGPRQSWPLEMHLARNFVAERVALIGDAAHGVHPIAGQGLNLALRDVAALAEVVADAARLGLDIGGGEVLARYERWRRFDSALSAAVFDGLNRLFSNESDLLRAARRFGLGALESVPLITALFVKEAAGLTGELPRLLKGETI